VITWELQARVAAAACWWLLEWRGAACLALAARWVKPVGGFCRGQWRFLRGAVNSVSCRSGWRLRGSAWLFLTYLLYEVAGPSFCRPDARERRLVARGSWFKRVLFLAEWPSPGGPGAARSASE